MTVTKPRSSNRKVQPVHELKSIVTEYWAKPIPVRQFDWTAVDDDTYEPGCPVGYGATEAEAIADLREQLEDAQ